MEKEEFYLSLLFLVTGFCFLSFALLLLLIDDENSIFFWWTGGIALIVGICMWITEKRKTGHT